MVKVSDLSNNLCPMSTNYCPPRAAITSGHTKSGMRLELIALSHGRWPQPYNDFISNMQQRIMHTKKNTTAITIVSSTQT